MNFKSPKSFDNLLIWCDVSTGHNRPYITAKFRRKVFSNLHGLGHPSHRATKPLINTRFVWHGMNIDIAKWCRSCKGCLCGWLCGTGLRRVRRRSGRAGIWYFCGNNILVIIFITIIICSHARCKRSRISLWEKMSIFCCIVSSASCLLLIVIMFLLMS